MTTGETDILVGGNPINRKAQLPTGDYVQLLGETYYRICQVDQMPPFFISLVSGADHWLFIASNGGLTAGRTNADSALFPYETEDKITAHSEHTGSKSIVRVTRNGRAYLWEPFSERYAGIYRCERHLYKNIYGNKLILEEVNHDLQLTMHTAWRTGDRFGFIRSGWLQNGGDQACRIALLDGLQNLLPYGATTDLQSSFSNLLDAYKRNELKPTTGLGIFSLSATLTDRAEPSESLQATVAWQTGLDVDCYLLSTRQMDAFRHGHELALEQDVCGTRGAYLVSSQFELAPGETKQWHIVADVNQDAADVVRLDCLLSQPAAALSRQLEADVEATTGVLVNYVAAADGLQLTASEATGPHHFANVMFNIMRGGVFANGYQVEKEDLLAFIATRNRPVLQAHRDWFAALPESIELGELYAQALATGEPDLVRLGYEYLPLTFSRRHGDPSRPWNHFSINLKHPDGSPRLDYQGNWRDIFQNWEPLLVSFPTYVEGAIAKFLNATTVDGYNPYRVTRAGVEWEVPEPDHPWANTGYWSDHQIIYLQKLLEIAVQVNPGMMRRLWNWPVFSYADVPYRLRPYDEMLADWSDTIVFDWERQRESVAAVAEMGTDGRLHRTETGHVAHVTMMEKLLVLLLAKLTNLVPEGGIWMNTQRPEWNDANNALVGKGLSVVTTAYLRRFVAFWLEQLAEAKKELFPVNAAVAALFANVQGILAVHKPQPEQGFTDTMRRSLMDQLGAAATAYRQTIYEHGPPEASFPISGQAIHDLLALVLVYLEHTLQANRRADGLYHGYNILRLRPAEAGVDRLYQMLEGQVAILSSGMLAPEEALALLQSLRQSDLYRADQHSYMLYPDRSLPGFQLKNYVAATAVAGSALVAAMTAIGDPRLLLRDDAGDYHFNGQFRNGRDVAQVLDALAQEAVYAEMVTAERETILELFEATFNHRAFTGRSGTFFAYEGLGSIYWHMVSKLLLAAQECYWAALNCDADPAVTSGLAEAYYDIRAGLGFNQSPQLYGAFPTDPYSHTPKGGGARQPGMTGQVKEEILARWGELGVLVQAGALRFAPTLLRDDEFLDAVGSFDYVDISGQKQTIALPAGTLGFTFCQTPVIYARGQPTQIMVRYADGRSRIISGSDLDAETSQQIFSRDGQVRSLHVTVG
jgi:hypothetical protein